MARCDVRAPFRLPTCAFHSPLFTKVAKAARAFVRGNLVLVLHSMPCHRSRVVVWCGVLAAALAEPASSRRELIVGGGEATPHDFSFVLSLQAWGSHTCGAALVTPDWALTAAHCAQSPTSAYSVSVHRHDLSVQSSADHPDLSLIHI